MDQENKDRFEKIEGLTEKAVMGLDKLTDIVSKLVGVVSDHDDRMKTLTQDIITVREQIQQLRQAQERTDEQLAVVIRMVDDWIRSQAAKQR